MVTKILIVLLVVTVLAVNSEFSSKFACTFDVAKSSIKFLQNSNILQANPDSKIQIQSGSDFSVECNFNGVKTQEGFRCILGDIVRTSDGSTGKLQEIFEYAPTPQPKFKESVYRNCTCYNDYTNIVIELKRGDHSYVLAIICHNEDTSETLVTQSTIRGKDLDDSELINRPGFKEAGFYPDLSANDCYTKIEQFETVAEILGSEEQASEFLKPESNLFLSRGHLMPNADGIEGYEKKATFYYVNVVGQWQNINAGNWKKLENITRWIAAKRQGNLTVYTGAAGVMTLPDVNNNEAQIWLGRRSNGELMNKLPVPHLIWKVIHDELLQEAVAVVMVNNPWISGDDEEVICHDVCDQLLWVNWNRTDVFVGFTYCCSVADFYTAVPYAPNLGNLPLLKESLPKEPKTDVLA